MKRTSRISVQSRRAYTLLEVIIAIAVMAVTVPIALGLVVAGGESSRNSEQTTRAVMTARSVFEELRRAADGTSGFLTEADFPWKNSANVTGDWLLFEVDREGRLLGLAREMKYDEAWAGQGREVTSIAAVRGLPSEFRALVASGEEPLTTFRLELRVEFPARAMAVHRDREVYFKTDLGR